MGTRFGSGMFRPDELNEKIKGMRSVACVPSCELWGIGNLFSLGREIFERTGVQNNLHSVFAH